MDVGEPLPRFAVADIETSGLSTRWHRVLQVAVATVVDGELVDEWSSLVRVRWPWQRIGPRHVHGLSRDQLRDAPPRNHVLLKFAEHVDGAVLCAHNIEFDWAFLARDARRSGVDLRPAHQLCTLRLSRWLDPDRALSHRLGDVCARYGVVNERAHDARFDARATAQVLPYLLADHGVSVADDLEPLYSS